MSSVTAARPAALASPLRYSHFSDTRTRMSEFTRDVKNNSRAMSSLLSEGQPAWFTGAVCGSEAAQALWRRQFDRAREGFGARPPEAWLPATRSELCSMRRFPDERVDRTEDIRWKSRLIKELNVYRRLRLPRSISVARASSFGSQNRRNCPSHVSMSRIALPSRL